MFPLKDDIPSRHFPVVNLWLIIVNILCFVYQSSLGPELEGFIITHGFVPVRFAAEQAGNVSSLGSYLPIFSAMFLHGGLLHLFSNLWMLWIFGYNVEGRMGPGRYILFYLVEIPAYFFIGVWFLMQFLQGAAQQAAVGLGEGGVAWWAHVGGFVAGGCLLYFFKRSPGEKSRQVLL